MRKPTAFGVHCFMGALTYGIAKSLDVKAQLEVFPLGEETVEHNLKIPFYKGAFEDWMSVLEETPVPDVLFGNPRCTGFSALGHGCSEDAHGAWSKPTEDIRQLVQVVEYFKPRIWGFESVQQAGTTGRELLDWIDQEYGKGYQWHELYHCAAQFGNAQHRKRVYYVWVKDDLKLPVTEVTADACKPFAGRHVRTREIIEPYWNDPVIELTAQEFDAVDLQKADYWKARDGRYNSYTLQANKSIKVALGTVIEGRSLNHVPPNLLPEPYAEKRRMGISFSFHAPRRLHRDRACPVVYSGSTKFLHPEHQRALSVRELSALMGLPDDWVVLGWAPVAQLGKGVTAQVGEWLGKMFAACLNEDYEGEPDTYGRVASDGRHHRWELDDPMFGWNPKRPQVPKYIYEEEVEA